MLGITDFWTYVLGSAAIILLPGPNSIFVLSVGARRGVRAGYRAAAGVFLGDTVLMTLSAAGVASLLRTYPPLFLVIKYAGAAYLLWVGLGIIRGALRRLRQRTTPTASTVDATDTVGPANRMGPAGTVGGPAATVGPANSMGPADTVGAAGTNRAAGTARPTGSLRATGSLGADAAEAGARQMSTAEAGTQHAGNAAEPSDLRHPFRRAAVISLLNPKAILFFVSFFIQFVEPGYPHPALSFLVLGAVVQLFSSLYLTALIFGGKFLAGQFRRRRKLAAGAATGVGALFVGFGIKLATASVS